LSSSSLIKWQKLVLAASVEVVIYRLIIGAWLAACFSISNNTWF
jgi:hypothetical protein